MKLSKKTVLEYFQKKGKKVGLVTTTHMTHATPACFGAHEPSRNSYAQIAADYFSSSRPDVLLGGGGKGMTEEGAVAVGYTVVSDRAGMLKAVTDGVDKLCGQFGAGHMPYEFDGVGELPHLHEMTSCALELLEDAPGGFFLTVPAPPPLTKQVRASIVPASNYTHRLKGRTLWQRNRRQPLPLRG